MNLIDHQLVAVLRLLRGRCLLHPLCSLDIALFVPSKESSVGATLSVGSSWLCRSGSVPGPWWIAIITFKHIHVRVSIVFFCQAWVVVLRLLAFKSCLTPLSQFFLEKHSISSVAFVDGVRDITKKWHEADDEIDRQIHVHLADNMTWKSTIDLHRGADDHSSQKSVDDVADTVSALGAM